MIWSLSLSQLISRTTTITLSSIRSCRSFHSSRRTSAYHPSNSTISYKWFRQHSIKLSDHRCPWDPQSIRARISGCWNRRALTEASVSTSSILSMTCRVFFGLTIGFRSMSLNNIEILITRPSLKLTTLLKSKETRKSRNFQVRLHRMSKMRTLKRSKQRLVSKRSRILRLSCRNTSRHPCSSGRESSIFAFGRWSAMMPSFINSRKHMSELLVKSMICQGRNLTKSMYIWLIMLCKSILRTTASSKKATSWVLKRLLTSLPSRTNSRLVFPQRR